MYRQASKPGQENAYNEEQLMTPNRYCLPDSQRRRKL